MCTEWHPSRCGACGPGPVGCTGCRGTLVGVILTRAARLAALSLALVAALLVDTAAAQVALPPRADRSVHDVAGILSNQAIDTMERLHGALLARTGVAIVIVTMPSLEGEPAADFALRIAEAWQPGRAGEDRGIVVVIALEERELFIATGYGVEGFLPDGRVGGVRDFARPALAQNDFSTGLLQISQALTAFSAEEFGVTIDGATLGVAAARGGRGRDERRGGIVGLLVMLGMGFLLFRHPTLFFLLMFSGVGRGYGGYRHRAGFGGAGGSF